ncbi:uncharacterized protein EDB91DRAFT_1253421 [Suillus paluster]|uniref:uncharacterized protein n=1 Tax=Suillus paluster TaxID=48578 RepID=UPI001B85E01D|nr:uncharacterized protein EDB91DRAFT_1253421 [Suillus paluster]KAG1728490.1 hypothetical protein EDB91DRAFT_1253421 [Suillus paluster]
MTAAPSVSIPKQVAFTAQGKLIVGGSDHGLVYVFKRKSGKLFETLCHSNTGLVQTIATHNLNGRCTVASASPALGRGKATINLWVYNYGPAKETLTSEDSRPMSHVIMRAFKILVHFGALVVIICFFDNKLLRRSGNMVRRPRPTHGNDLIPEAHQEVDEQSNTLMLHELAGKLIKVIREAERDGGVGEDIHDVTRHDEIAAEAERVFFEAVKAGEDDIRRARRQHNDSGKDDILL